MAVTDSATLPFSSVGMRSRSTPPLARPTAFDLSPGVSLGWPRVEDGHMAPSRAGSPGINPSYPP